MICTTARNELYRRAFEHGRARWGVIALLELLALGVPQSTVRSWLRTGRLIRLYRAVYALGHDALRAEGRWLAAVLACGDGAALSHGAAAAYLDLRASAARLIDVSTEAALRPRQGIRLHRPRCLLPEDIVDKDGIRTTSPTRTLIDLAAVLPSSALERVAANAEHRGLIDHDRLRLARSPKLRALFDLGAPVRTRSSDEDRFLIALRATDIPSPEVNAWLTHGGGEEWQADFLWRSERVVVEVDDDSHRTRHAFELDRRKDAVRQADGYRTLRFTKRQIREDPARVMTILAAVVRK